MPNSNSGTAPGSRFLSTYQLAFTAIAAFAFVTVGAGLIFRVADAEPPGDVDGLATAEAQMPPELDEASGLAMRSDGQSFWSHNDDPGPAVVYALDLEGRVLESHEFPDVEMTDFEDIAAGVCPPGESAERCLYLADTGDNDRARAESRVIAVVEPTSDAPETRVVGVARFSYEGGESHDVESLALDTDRILLVSKGQEGSADVFEVPLDAFAPDAESESASEARRVGILSIDVDLAHERPTSAAVSPDGRTLGVRTARSFYRFPLEDLSAEPVSCPIGADEPQGEAVDFLDDARVLLSGETVDGVAAPIVELRCPGAG